MNPLVRGMQLATNETKTENGMKTNKSSLNACLDLFFMGGASRKKSETEIESLFAKAYGEDPALAVKILGYIRDPRGGMGERRFFRICLKYLARINGDISIGYIPEIGRWDDLFELFGGVWQDNAIVAFKSGIELENGLCAKWMPRKGKEAELLREALGLTHRDYRKTLVKLTKVVETQMCKKEWKAINYSGVPSVANVKYNKAFLRNDEQRRRDFLAKAVKGEVKINSAVAFPHDIIYRTGVRGDWQSATAMWNQLPDYLKDSDARMLPMCDVSGSMSGTPMEISVSLGLYLSERNKSVFKDVFLTFSANPKLQILKGDLQTRYLQLIRAEWGMNTNLMSAFDLVLSSAINNKVAEADMPTHIIIISDMEFDHCVHTGGSAMEAIEARYKAAGYQMPAVIFWNVNSRQSNVPVTFNKTGVGLVSGASPSTIKAVLSGEIDPIKIMLRAVETEKYQRLVP